MASGRLIAFEGVDGAGKSTAIRLVAERLQAQGERVFMPRSGKEHDSRPTRHIRRLTRDRRNLDLTPRAELLLYCAREAQVLEELVRPALARGETVLVDRSLLTPEVLGRARGLGAEECARAATLAAGGREPDMTLVFEVHPRTSRIRKRVERIREHTLADGGRKGLAGSGLKERVRDLYQAIAAERGFPVLNAERATPDELAELAATAIKQGPGARVEQSELDRTPRWLVDPSWSFERALPELPTSVALFLSNGLVCARELRRAAVEEEPELCAWALDPEDPLRDALAMREPEYALRAWHRRPLSGPDDLRLRLLESAPAVAIAGLKHLATPEADALRERYADSEPNAVLTSLTAREDDVAWRLRRRCWKKGEDAQRATSIGFCASDEAWALRERLFEKNPVIGLGTLRGLDDARTNALLERYADSAPKRVLAALGGRTDDFAHAMRRALFETGREVVDSVRGLDDDASWELRERGVERWPSTVAHSLLGIDPGERVAAMVARCGSLAKGDVHVLRRLKGLEERPGWPEWARARTRDGLADGTDVAD